MQSSFEIHDRIKRVLITADDISAQTPEFANFSFFCIFLLTFFTESVII